MASNEIFIPAEITMAENEKIASRALRRDRLFVLLLGPSATGKSTIINELNRQHSSPFVYVQPYMTRENRPNETDKISTSEEHFQEMQDNDEFVVVNELYGVRYGTPLRGILEPLQAGANPILDYPLDTIDALRRPDYDLLSVYIYPPSLDAWRQRIEDSGRNKNGRLEAGTKELGRLALAGFRHPDIDLSIINDSGHADVAAAQIINTLENYTVKN